MSLIHNHIRHAPGKSARLDHQLVAETVSLLTIGHDDATQAIVMRLCIKVDDLFHQVFAEEYQRTFLTPGIVPAVVTRR